MRWSGAQLWLAFVGWILVALCSLLVWALVRSPWGRVVKSIREDEDAARSLGKNVYAYKMQALVLGGVIGALGGTVYALGLGSVNPDQYQNANTFLAYTALILGGAATVLGPVIGGMILLFLIQFADTGLKALISNGIIPETLLSATDVALAALRPHRRGADGTAGLPATGHLRRPTRGDARCPLIPTPHGATAAGGDTPHGFHPGKAGGFRSGDAPQRLAQAALRDLPWEIGVAKPDPAIVVDGVTRTFGGLTAVSVDHLEVQRGGITGLIGPNGAGKTTLFNLLTGFDQPDTGTWSFDGKSLGKLSPHQVARLGVVRTFQLTKALSRLTVLQNMLLGAQGQKGESFFRALVPGTWKAQETVQHREGPGPAAALQAGRQEGRFRRHAVRRSAQAAGDGAGTHERPPGRHARRADGRREPRADPEPARPRQGPARAGHDGDLRRARHGRRP